MKWVSLRGMAELLLPYRAPIAWEALLGFLSARAIAGVEWSDGRVFHRAIDIEGARGVIEVVNEEGASAVRILIPPALMEHERRVASLVRHMFDLDADPGEIARHFERDPLLGPLAARLPGVRVPGTWDPFELALRAVIGQQISVSAARGILSRLAREYGVAVDVTGEPAAPEANGSALAAVDRTFPSPGQLSRAFTAGMPESRLRTLRELVAGAISGSFPLEPRESLADTVAALQRQRGVGPWTAHYIAMRAFRLTDAFPSGDLALQKALVGDERDVDAGKLPNARIEKRLIARAEPWRPYRAYAAMLLWNA